MTEDEKKEKQHGLDLAFRVLSAQPGVIKPSDDAKAVIIMIAEMAELLLSYEKTGKIPAITPAVVLYPGA